MKFGVRTIVPRSPPSASQPAFHSRAHDHVPYHWLAGWLPPTDKLIHSPMAVLTMPRDSYR